MARDIDLNTYLPQFIDNFREMREIMDAENPEFQFINKQTDISVDNLFIVTCNETGIRRFENLLGIIPNSGDSLETRKRMALARWNDIIPYTIKVFLQKIYALCGNDYSFIPHWNKYSADLETHLDTYGQISELERIIDYMIPANITFNAYNKLNYTLAGSTCVASGLAYADVFQLSDSYKAVWQMNSDAGAAASGSGTCSIEITDSYNGSVGSEGIVNAGVGMMNADEITVSDSDNKTLAANDDIASGQAISLTEII